MIVVGGWPGRVVIGLNGRFGVRPSAIAVGGDFPSPLADDVDAGDGSTEIVAVVTALPSSGVVSFSDDGAYSHVGAADGTHTTTLALYAWAPGGPLTQPGGEGVTSIVGSGGGTEFVVAPESLISGSAVGTPAFDFVAGPEFVVTPASIVSGSIVGTPVFDFELGTEFVVAPESFISGSAVGTPTFSFSLDQPMEPVTLAEAKVAARVDDDLGDSSSLDALIESYITAAREHAEHVTGRCYVRQTRRFECRDWADLIKPLPIHQATACAISYWRGGEWAALDAGEFDFAPGGIGGNSTVIACGSAWPALGARAIGPRVRVDLTAGPDSPAAVPAQVKTFIKASVAAWVKSPEAQATGTVSPNRLFERLLDAQKLYG